MEVRRASVPCSRSPSSPPPAPPPECMRSASLPTWPTTRPRRRMLSEFLTAWSHGRAPTGHDSFDTARDNIERHQECEEEDTRDRTDVGDQDGDDADRGPDVSPLRSTLLAATPHAAEGLVDQTGPRILEDPEGIAARILEDVTGSRRNLDGSTLRLPTAGPQVLRRRLQILHFEQGQARGSGTVVREEVLRPFRESESSNVRPELVVIPKDGRTEDLGVVFQIAFEIRGSDVEVSEPTEWRSHGRRNAFLGIITLGRATKHEIEQQGMGARGPTDGTTEGRDHRGRERGHGLEQRAYAGRL